MPQLLTTAMRCLPTCKFTIECMLTSCRVLDKAHPWLIDQDFASFVGLDRRCLEAFALGLYVSFSFTGNVTAGSCTLQYARHALRLLRKMGLHIALTPLSHISDDTTVKAGTNCAISASPTRHAMGDYEPRSVHLPSLSISTILGLVLCRLLQTIYANALINGSVPLSLVHVVHPDFSPSETKADRENWCLYLAVLTGRSRRSDWGNNVTKAFPFKLVPDSDVTMSSSVQERYFDKVARQG